MHWVRWNNKLKRPSGATKILIKANANAGDGGALTCLNPITSSKIVKNLKAA